MTDLMIKMSEARVKAAKLRKEKGIKVQNPLEKAKANPKSFRYACNAMCYQCIYDDTTPGTWRQQVKNCTSPDCALYTLRPVSQSRKERGLE